MISLAPIELNSDQIFVLRSIGKKTKSADELQWLDFGFKICFIFFSVLHLPETISHLRAVQANEKC